MAASDTLIDTLFDGRYRIVRRLGSGGMATVYLAEDEVLGRRVAIKILNERYANDEQFVERFRREAKSAAALSHPNIVSIYDRGEAERTYYIAMEHLDGRTLKQLILARGPAPIRVAIEYTRQILAALRFAHRHGIVHRDIKPHNAIVDAEGRAKVTDFGIARAGAASQVTEAGSIVGTAQYLSPEQARGSPVDQRSDLYSVGIVLYELLTGTVPFTGETPVEIAMKHLSETPEPPSSKRSEIPHDLDLVVMRALAKDPDERYQSAEEMDADLQRIARGAAVSRRTEEAATAIIAAPTAMPTTITRAPATVREPPPPSARPVYYDYDEPLPARRPVWPWLLALVLVAAAAVAGFLVYQQIQDQLAATKPIAVPGVVGARRVVATERLSQAGFDPRVRYDHSDEVAVGYVISQDPEGGDRAEKGSIVHLTVSLGKELVAVPALKGQQLTQAIAKVASLGLTPRTFPVPSDEPQGTVTGQNPPPGKKVAKDTAVRINYSKGPERIQVPSLLGQQYDAAAAALQTIGLVPARRFTDSNQPAGTVLDQDPAGGEFLPKGSTVTLFVSKGPPSVTVPSVLKLDEEAAKQRLQAYGLRADVIEQDVTDDLLNGFVLTQDPVAGRQVTPNSVVTITVGRFKPEKAPVP